MLRFSVWRRRPGEIQLDPNMKTPAAFSAFVISKTKAAIAARKPGRAIAIQ